MTTGQLIGKMFRWLSQMKNVPPTKPHRHAWQRRSEINSDSGLTYVWWRCACGKRRVDTLGPTGRVGRRYVPATLKLTTQAVIPGPGTIKADDFMAAVKLAVKK